jgi:two-component system NarL family sensor kinase
VFLEVEDRGRGFPVDVKWGDQAKAALGVGISGMRERIRQFDGELRIHSGSGGTTISVTVPLKKELHAPAIVS